MQDSDLSHAAAVLAAAMIGPTDSPEVAARTYYRCLQALRSQGAGETSGSSKSDEDELTMYSFARKQLQANKGEKGKERG